MRVLQGKKVVDAPEAWREHLGVDSRRVEVDLGAGDGRYVYEEARRDAESLYIAVDPDANSLGEYAYRASRKPARGGVNNALFVVAAVEGLPEDLRGIAGRVRVNFPWGSLLRGLLGGDVVVLDAVASLLKKGGEVEMVLAYEPEHDHGAFAGQALPPLDPAYVRDQMVPAFEAGGLIVREWRRLTQDEALAIPSTWGRRLLHARPREVFFLQCVPVRDL